MPFRKKSFRETLSEIMKRFSAGGIGDTYMQSILAIIRNEISRALPDDDSVKQTVRESLTKVFENVTNPRKLSANVPGVKEYTIAMVKPELRKLLDQKILQSVNLITLRRDEAVERTLARFQGWTTSIPPTGATKESIAEAKENILKSTARERFEWRRVTIDQGHKLSANVEAVVALQNGAIAAEWRSHWRDASYNARPDHKARDKKIYAIRGNDALRAGLMKRGKNGYWEDMTQPAEEPYCRCWARYINNLNDLPDDMLTEKGRKAL